jgi:hypothetical protein
MEIPVEDADVVLMEKSVTLTVTIATSVTFHNMCDTLVSNWITIATSVKFYVCMLLI